MTTVGAYEAKTHLGELLQQVEAGDVVTITRHGRAVARLVPAAPATGSPDAVVAAIRRARVGIRKGRLSVKQMVHEGRR